MSGGPPPDTWSSTSRGAGGSGYGAPPPGQGGYGGPPQGGGYGQGAPYGQPPGGPDAAYEALIRQQNEEQASGGGGQRGYGASLGAYPPQQQQNRHGHNPQQYPQQPYPGPYGGPQGGGSAYHGQPPYPPSYAQGPPPSHYGAPPPMQHVPSPHVPFGPAHPAAGYVQPPNAPAPQYGPSASGPTTGWTPSGRKRALLIGINYAGTPSALAGCVNDVRYVQFLLASKFGFRSTDFVILTDEPVAVPGARMGRPTREGILTEMRRLVSGTAPGDSLFLHFSGHGKQIPDVSGDEEDGMDEAILPSDYQRSGHIVDDEMYHMLVRPLPRGVRLTAIIDACSSGTALDLPYVHGGAPPHGGAPVAGSRGGLSSLLSGAGGGGGNAALASMAMAALGGGKKPMMGGGSGGGGAGGAGSLGALLSAVVMGASGHPLNNKQKARLVEKRQPNPNAGEVIAFSACEDHATAADTHGAVGGHATGACTYSFIQAIEHGGRDWRAYTFDSLLVEMRRKMRAKGLKQVPQLTSSFPMSTSSRFIL